MTSYPLKSNHSVIQLKISFNKEDYPFWYQEGKSDWTQMKEEPSSGKWLSTGTAGGFTDVYGACMVLHPEVTVRQKPHSKGFNTEERIPR